MSYAYQPGFNNEFSSEALPSALPAFGNNPQKCPYDLYAEQISGTAFTAPRRDNRRTWMYRIQPSVLHSPFTEVTAPDAWSGHGSFADASLYEINPNQLQWLPLPLPTDKEKKTFTESLVTMGGYGDTCAKSGHAVRMYSCTESMKEQAMQNSD